MDDGHTPGDLRWPPPADDDEPFELLEIVRDETGRARWRRDQRAPEVPDTYREWLPKRLGRESAIQHDELDMFPSAAAEHAAALPPTVAAPAEPVQVASLPASPVAHVARARPLHAAPVDAPADVSVPALRLSLLPPGPGPTLTAPASAHRSVGATAERLGLLAAGALVGSVVTLVGMTLSRSDGSGDDRPAPPLTRERPALPAAAPVSAPTLSPQVDVPASGVASVATAPKPDPVVAAARPVPTLAAPVAAAPVPSLVPAPTPLVETSGASPRKAASPVPPVAAEAVRVLRPAVSEEPAIVGTVQQYAAAWSRLDARAIEALWPSVDRQALVDTFTAIREQRLTLASCKATVVADSAAVTCRGTRRYRPRVGQHSTRTEQGRWTFDLARREQAWVISNVARP